MIKNVPDIKVLKFQRRSGMQIVMSVVALIGHIIQSNNYRGLSLICVSTSYPGPGPSAFKQKSKRSINGVQTNVKILISAITNFYRILEGFPVRTG